MVLDYLQRAAVFHESPPQYDHTRGQPYDGDIKRRLSKSSQQRTLLSPVTRLLRTSAEAVNSAVLYARDGLTDEQRAARRKLEERKQILHLRLKNAEEFEDWKTAAKELDVLEDNEAWKLEKDSEECDAPLIEERLQQLDDARISCDVSRMLYLVRTSLSRDLGGMSNSRLYKYSHIGTKDLVERYIDSTLATIRALVKTSAHSLPAGIETKDILEQVVYARQAFGRSALLLSGGATFGMNHVGVLKALFDAQLLPRIISGASAGSIVCAVLCTRKDEEIPDLLKTFPHGDLAVFEDQNREDGLLERIGRFLTQGAWIDMKHLIRVMKEYLGDITFQEAYNRTRRILNICVSSASIYELPRLLNYVTSPNVMIWSAVAASCSVPLLFSAAHLLVKNPVTGEHLPWNPTPQRWIDGSVDNDLPMTRLAEMFNVNHFIVSQVNPHVVPFLANDDASLTHDGLALAPSSTRPDWLYTLTQLAKGEALHRMQVLADLGIFPNLVTKARSVLSQKYSGDITILPEIYYRDFPRMLKNPTAEFMMQACLCGERATWPKLSRVRNHCAVELELDSAVQQLRARVVFSPSQVDLRRLTVGGPQGGAAGVGNGSGMTRAAPGGVRRRRVSVSNAVRLMVRDDSDSDDESSGTGGSYSKATKRPPLRPTKSNLGPHLHRKHPQLASLAPLFPRTPPHSSAILKVSSPPFPVQERPSLLLKVPDPTTSEADTTSDGSGGGAGASRGRGGGDRRSSEDMDADSRTDESSPEPEDPVLRVQGREDEGYMPSRASFFSVSQPATPSIGVGAGWHGSGNGMGMGSMTGSALTATTPLLSPELVMRGRGGSVAGFGAGGEATRVDVLMNKNKRRSSPERKYWGLFHHGNNNGTGTTTAGVAGGGRAR